LEKFKVVRIGTGERYAQKWIAELYIIHVQIVVRSPQIPK